MLLEEASKGMLRYQSEINEVLPVNADQLIRMRVFLPSPRLTYFVESYTALVAAQPLSDSRKWHIMPDSSAYLNFHLLTTQIQENGSGVLALKSRLRLVGPRSVYTEINRKGRLVTILTRFKPGGAQPFLKFPINEITDSSIGIDDLWGNEGKRLLKMLTYFSSEFQLEKCIAVLEQTLLRQLKSSNPENALLRESIRYIRFSEGNLKVSHLANHLGISERHLRNIIKSRIGLGPKQFSRVERVTRLVRMANSNAREGWAGLAISAGYYDQAHMIDEFRTLIGDSPEAFVKRMKQV